MGSVAKTENLQKLIPKARWWRIIPPTIIIYITAYMDRMNISFAMAGGMNEQLGLSMAASGLAAGIFFWGYMVLQVPGGHIAEHGRGRKMVSQERARTRQRSVPNQLAAFGGAHQSGIRLDRDALQLALAVFL